MAWLLAALGVLGFFGLCVLMDVGRDVLRARRQIRKLRENQWRSVNHRGEP